MSSSVIRQRIASASLLEYASIYREEGLFNDITVVAENKSIPANRLVLSCYSRYFEGMFKSRMKERYENIIEVKAIGGNIMQALIDYIYNGSITICNENVMYLLSGADYLQLKDVKQFCFEFLQANLTPFTALSILRAAVLYRNDPSVDEIQRYMVENFSLVSQTEDFKSFSKEELISIVSNLNFFEDHQVKGETVYEAVISWTRHDKHRKNDFGDLLELIDLDKVSVKFLEERIFDEELIKESFACQKLVMKAYRKQITKQKTQLQTSKLLTFGGSDTGSKVRIVFDLLNEPCVKYPDLPQELARHCSLKLKDHVYCIGGKIKQHDAWKTTNDVRRLNLVQENSVWEPIAAMNEKRRAFGAAVYYDSLIAVGGFDQNYKNLASCEFYQTSLKKWKFVSASLKQKRWGHTVVSCDGYLYALGGYSVENQHLSSVERLHDLTAEKWENVKPMLTPRRHFAAVNCGREIYAIGGMPETRTALKSVEKYIQDLNRWKYMSDMNIERTDHSACVLQGKIYVVGGLDKTGEVVKEIDCYDAMTDRWNIVGNVSDELHCHSMIVL